MSGSEDSSASEEGDHPYPPWLDDIIQGDESYWDEVVVLEEARGSDSFKTKDWIEVKAIRVPDPADAAAGLRRGQCRTYVIERYTTGLIASDPLEPPYIGLVDKVFRRRDAKPYAVVEGRPVYKAADFGVHAYWFYRPLEVPEGAWRKGRAKKVRKAVEGRAQYQLPGESLEQREVMSERRVLFSSHHTLHDIPDGQGVQSLDCFLHTCVVHWLEGEDPPDPVSYRVHGGQLLRVLEPGFVVHGFLWCGRKRDVHLAADAKVIFPFINAGAYKWNDPDTAAIVKEMFSRYQKTEAQRQARNQGVVSRYHAAKAAGLTDIPSDDGDEPDAQHAAAAAAGAAAASTPRGPLAGTMRAGTGGPISSPRLEGVEEGPVALTLERADPSSLLDDDED